MQHPHRFYHYPRLEALEGRLSTGGILAALSLSPAGLLPDLAALDAEVGPAGFALTAPPAARGSLPDSGNIGDAAAISATGAFVGPVPAEAGAASPRPGPGGNDVSAASRTADPWPAWAAVPATPVCFSAGGVGAGSGRGTGESGPVLPLGQAPAPGIGRCPLGAAGERPPLLDPAQAVARPAAPLTGTTASPAQAAQIRQAYGQLPLRFEANAGQTDAQVQFLAHGSGYNLFLTSTEAVLALQAPANTPAPNAAPSQRGPSAAKPPAGPETVLRMEVLGGNPTARGVGALPLPGQVNYFLGNDPRQWHTHVATYGRVDYANVYPGIDLTYYGNQQQLEYDFVVAPGADPSHIRLGFTDADSLTVDSQGALEVQAGGQVLRQQAPVLYQDIAGVRQPVAGRFVITGQTVGFAVGAYDPSWPLVIDPVLSYSTYLGGSSGNGDYGESIAVDGAGNAYLTGYTHSTDFPTANAFQPTMGNSQYDTAFVTKVSADGSSLVYSSYLGGSGGNGDPYGDIGTGIAVDAAGNAYVTGSTSSSDFPIVNAFQPTKGGPSGNSNAFVAKVSADGSSLVYSSYLGGSGYSDFTLQYGDKGYGIAVDAAGNAYVTGQTISTDFPTANAFQPTKGGANDVSNAFVTKVSADGSSLVYSSYLGGSGLVYGPENSDAGQGIAVDGAGNAYVTGYTSSTDFPTVHAFQPTTGNPDNDTAFVTKVSADGSSLVYSSFLGGSGSDNGAGIAVDAAGNAYLTGITLSTDFPTVHAFQPTPGGGIDNDNAFVTKVSADGSSLVYSSYLGGSGYNLGYGIAADAAGNAYLTGVTSSTDFPTANAFQPTLRGRGNAFVTKVSADGSSLVYSSYLGGSGDNNYGGESGNGIAVDAAGNAYLTGSTTSADFPTVNPLQQVKGGTGAFQSSDGGATWQAIDGTLPNALANSDVRSLAVDPANPSLLYAGTNGGGIFQSTDAGASWTASNNGLTNLAVQTVVLAPTNPAVLYAGTNGGGVFQSTDGGASWSARNNGLTNTNVHSLAVDPATPATVYVATDGGLFKSTDGGSSWLSSNNGLPTNSLQGYAVAIDPTNPATLYTSIRYRSGLLTVAAVYKSTDGGADWSYSSSGLSALASALVVDPVTPSNVYAVAGGIYKSTDGGTSWSAAGLNHVNALALDPTAPTTLYAGAYVSGPNGFVAKISGA
jgi:photosystem II stability/assembly factor-like uncharacterized protein